MACKTCDHTMHQIAGSKIEPGNRVFWCPRCGTLGRPDSYHENEVPKLVGRVVEFGGLLVDERLIQEFERLGIAEAISLER
jgi:hypothetical protein